MDDVKNVYSFSQDNVAIVLVEYNYGTNIDTAYINLKKAIDGIKSDLPDDANEPNIMEMDMNSQPVITLAVGGQVDGNLYTYVENNIKPEPEKLGSVLISFYLSCHAASFPAFISFFCNRDFLHLAKPGDWRATMITTTIAL